MNVDDHTSYVMFMLYMLYERHI